MGRASAVWQDGVGGFEEGKEERPQVLVLTGPATLPGQGRRARGRRSRGQERNGPGVPPAEIPKPLTLKKGSLCWRMSATVRRERA